MAASERFVNAIAKTERFPERNFVSDRYYGSNRGRVLHVKWLPEDASLMGVTYHRGTQRSYIFIVHPDREAHFRNLIKVFLETK